MYKKTLRLLVSHLSDLIFTENNIENKEFYRDLDTLEKIISESFYNENKRIIVFAISHELINDKATLDAFSSEESQLN